MGTNRVGGIFSVICCALLAACHAAPHRVRVPVPESGAVIARQDAKDKTLLASADRIDTTVADTPAAAPVRVQTDAIRDAVATAPAAQVADLADQFSRALDAANANTAKLEAKLQKEELKDKAAYKRWLRTSAGALLLAFAVSVIFGKAAAAARTWPLALLALAAVALAEVIGSTWFQIGCLILLAGGVAYATYWVIDRHKQGRLQHAIEKRAALLREIVPILDQAYENASEDVKRILDRNLFDRFSLRFDAEAKAEIHDVRKEAAHA